MDDHRFQKIIDAVSELSPHQMNCLLQELNRVKEGSSEILLSEEEITMLVSVFSEEPK